MNVPHTETEQAGCCDPAATECGPECRTGPPPLPIMAPAPDGDEPCCGPPAGPPSSPFERPGYRLCPYVTDFLDTPAGRIPQVSTRLSRRDLLGTFRARLGISRDRYRIAPGLYGIGRPDRKSPVLVTANYKLTFDSLRRELADLDSWLLVLDTRGINVWCAAGKNTFSTGELNRRIQDSGLAEVVDHRRVILPQLGAPGVSAHGVKKGSGFEVIWGPVRARDLKYFLNNGLQADPAMRQPTFTITERLVLVPVELSLILKLSFRVLVIIFFISGLGPRLFDLQTAITRGTEAAAAYGAGVFAGAVLVPALLPWLPGRSFYLKGIVTGLAAGGGIVSLMAAGLRGFEPLALLLFSLSISSYAAMNFTGATPYTSPSGVEKEMRRGMPVQALAAVVALIVWVSAGFTA